MDGKIFVDRWIDKWADKQMDNGTNGWRDRWISKQIRMDRPTIVDRWMNKDSTYSTIFIPSHSYIDMKNSRLSNPFCRLVKT